MAPFLFHKNFITDFLFSLSFKNMISSNNVLEYVEYIYYFNQIIFQYSLNSLNLLKIVT